MSGLKVWNGIICLASLAARPVASTLARTDVRQKPPKVRCLPTLRVGAPVGLKNIGHVVVAVITPRSGTRPAA
jgi:hypothetical protein